MANQLIDKADAVDHPPASQPAAKGWATPPSLKEVLALAVVCCLAYLATIVVLANYWPLMKGFGDNRAYTSTAESISHWDIASIHTWQFWGLPYAMTAFSFLTRTSFWTALLFYSIAGSLVTVVACNSLWGGWVAAYFAVISRDWFERTVLGGAEPLFLALVFGSFLAARRQRWLLAATLASLSTVVRPMGIFALAAIGLVLLWQRQYKKLAGACLIGIVIGGLYLAPLKIYQHNSMANVNRYGEADGSGGRPITYPFAALLHPPAAFGAVHNWHDVNQGTTTPLNLARDVAWIVLVILGVVAMFFNRHFRDLARRYSVEFLFCVFYLSLLFTYNSPWARVAFPRYAIPIIPFVIAALEPWIPKDRRLLWAFGLASAVLAAASTLGITYSLSLIRKAL